MGRFSVIIPAYNNAHVIGRAVESVLSQVCQDFDVVVVDDGSEDNTEKSLRPYLGRICYIRQSNRGAAAARNRGIAESHGQYVAFLDSDDTWYPNKLSEMEKAIDAHPEAGLFYSDYRLVTAQQQLLRVERCRHVAGEGYSFLVLHNFIQTSTVVCRRGCFDGCGFFYEPLRRREDWDMWIRIARRFPIVHVPLVLGEYTWEPFKADRSSCEAAECRLIIDRTLQSDPALSLRKRRQILARRAYNEGVASLRHGRGREALACFLRGIVGEPLHYKGYVYFALAVTRLHRRLPHWMKVRLRIT